MRAFLLQAVGLVGFPVGVFIAAGVGAMVAAISVDLVFIGLAFEGDG